MQSSFLSINLENVRFRGKRKCKFANSSGTLHFLQFIWYSSFFTISPKHIKTVLVDFKTLNSDPSKYISRLTNLYHA